MFTEPEGVSVEGVRHERVREGLHTGEVLAQLPEAAVTGAVAKSVELRADRRHLVVREAELDPLTHLRIDDRSGDGVVAIVLEHKRTLAALPQLRAVKAKDPFAVDPSIAAITHGTISDPSAARAHALDAGTPPKKKT